VFQNTEISQSPCYKTRRCVYRNTEMLQSACIKHGDFSISVLQNTEISFTMYRNTEMLQSPCFIHGDFFFKGLYLSENTTDDKNILGCDLWDQVLQNYEKKRRSKISCYCPFKRSEATGMNDE